MMMYDELWKRYHRTRSVELRNQLVEKHLGLVGHLANKMYEHIHRKESYDDLFSEGVIGLIRVVERYIPEMAGFATFATLRIRGAMLDYLRDLQWGGRGIEDRKKIVPMDPVGSDDEVALLEFVDSRMDNQNQIDRNFNELFDDLTISLSPQEKRVILLRYKEGLKSMDIAKMIGRSEARASQLHIGAMKQIRKRIEGLDYV